MMKAMRILAASMSLALVLSACGEEDMGLLPETPSEETTTPAVGSASEEEPANDVATSNPGTGNPLSAFVEAGDTYFGPAGSDTNLDVSLSGNAAAGSRYGGPDDVVGVLVVVRNSRGYMEVVNLDNKNRFPVVFESTGEAFSVPADTLGGKPFPSLFVGEISSLTEFKFDHRIAPNPEKCNQYTATYNGAAVSSGNGKYLAKVTSSQGACRYTKAGV